jgi:hypothetical protein
MDAITNNTNGAYFEFNNAYKTFINNPTVEKADELNEAGKILAGALIILSVIAINADMIGKYIVFVLFLAKLLSELNSNISEATTVDATTVVIPETFPAYKKAIDDSEAALEDAFKATPADTPYGSNYVVSRSWALNKPIYSLVGANVQASTPISDCSGGYRAIFIEKPMNQMTFVGKNENTCFKQCSGKPKPRSAL